MLDTNIRIHSRQRRPAQVIERFRALRPGEVAMSPITRGALRLGLEKIRGTPDFAVAMRAFEELTYLIPAVSLDRTAADHYAVFRDRLRRNGLMIGNNALWTASHAYGAEPTLVTGDTRAFDRLKPDLKIEDRTERTRGAGSRRHRRPRRAGSGFSTAHGATRRA